MNEICTNLLRLRKAAGKNQAEVAAQAGITRLAYVNLEHGKSQPKSSTLVAIAKALQVPVVDLLRPVPAPKSLRFRTGKTLTAREKAHKQQAIIDLSEWLAAYKELEKLLDQPASYTLKEDSCKDPETVAIKARAHLKIEGLEPITDLGGLLSRAGIKLYFFDLDISRFFGASVGVGDGGPCIAVNRQGVTIERQIFTATHELGHLLMHGVSYGLGSEEVEDADQEQDANDFASWFLMPRASFDQAWQENQGLHWVDRVLTVKRYFRVSYATVLMRLVNERQTDTAVYQSFAMNYRARYGHDLKQHYEPDGLGQLYPTDEPDTLLKRDFCEERFSRLVRMAFDNELITLARAADLLRIPLDDMRDLAASWGEEPMV